jgi:hypothetical protein
MLYIRIDVVYSTNSKEGQKTLNISTCEMSLKNDNLVPNLTHHIRLHFRVTLTFMHILFCLFDCFEPHEQFFSYLADVTITDDRVANLDLCLALTAFSSEGSFTRHISCDTGRSHPKDRYPRLTVGFESAT